MPVDTHLRDAASGKGAKFSNDGALFVYHESPPPPAVGTANKRRFLNGLLGTSGFNAGTTNLRVNGLTNNVDAYVEAHPDYDIHIMSVSFYINDSAISMNRFGNVIGLTLGFDMFAEESGDTAYMVKQVLTNGQLIAQTAAMNAFGTGTELNIITNMTGTTDAINAFLDIGKILPPEGLRIGRGTKDKLVVRIRDNLSQISASGAFNVRIFGFKKYP